MRDILGLILGGGRGEPLYPLTKMRSEPAVPLAGKYRLIDIPISNCINSDVQRVYVITQFLSVSLHRHIGNTFKFDPFSNNFVEVLAAQQTNEASAWYRGIADAVRQNIGFIRDESPREVLLLSGDQLYRMDYREMAAEHRATGADVTMAVSPVSRARATRMGVVCCDQAGRLTGFVEKPNSDTELERVACSTGWMAERGLTDPNRPYLANMGLYLFSRNALEGLLAAHPNAVDLVREIIPHSLATHRFQVHLFRGYWDDLGSIHSYHEAHMALAGDDPPFDFASVEGTIYTRMRNLPAARVLASRVEHALISDGCLVENGARLERCVVGVRSRIGHNTVIRDAVINGSDRFETAEDRASNRRRGVPDIGIGPGSHIERAIVDKDCRIGCNVRLMNARGVRHADAENYVIRDGITVIPNGAIIPDGFEI